MSNLVPIISFGVSGVLVLVAMYMGLTMVVTHRATKRQRQMAKRRADTLGFEEGSWRGFGNPATEELDLRPAHLVEHSLCDVHSVLPDSPCPVCKLEDQAETDAVEGATRVLRLRDRCVEIEGYYTDELKRNLDLQLEHDAIVKICVDFAAGRGEAFDALHQIAGIVGSNKTVEEQLAEAIEEADMIHASGSVDCMPVGTRSRRYSVKDEEKT